MKISGRTGAAGKTALFGMFVALAMIMSYIETLIPFSFGIPGIKPGFANIVTMVCLYALGPGAAAAVSVTRIILISLTFGSMSAMLYSMAGGILSLVCMILARRSGRFGTAGVSIIGGITHNFGQLAAAALIVENVAVFWYFPVLLTAGTATGLVIGLLAAEILKRLPAGMK